MTGSGSRSTELEQLRRLVEERTADLQRVKAEYDNYRRRVRRDRLAVREIAVANVFRALLPVLDAVDRACAHEPLTPGLKDIAGSLKDQLGSLGVTSFGEVGDPFDPTCHDALAHNVRQDAESLVCSTVLRPGYRLGDHLLRPATVEVTGPAPPARNPLEGEQHPCVRDVDGSVRPDVRGPSLRREESVSAGAALHVLPPAARTRPAARRTRPSGPDKDTHSTPLPPP
ncbi:nucleotide exchange factor GrpE [Streptomyces sp. NK08204]|uniref:nucleotide exchange factor GrpE n=1 Tax=Streptomyces sp. NK08204 TaxID=2873260 RepID=UPI001CEC6C62|nr:nucleotide exchange factor GrpE [Streptomyces sp. NK08204]